MNYHKILGVSSNACKKTIREAYLKKVKLYHPDLNKSPDATTKFKQIQEAYQVLYNNDNLNKQGSRDEHPFTTSHNNKNERGSNYSDDFNEFHRAFYEEVRKMREAERNSQNKRYANMDPHYSFDYIFQKYPREFFYVNLIFKVFPLFVVPFLFFYIIYKQYLLKTHFREKPIVIYDAYGRAFLIDVQGKKFRASEFDKY